MINRISANKAARDFSTLIDHVRDQGASFEIECENEVVARIVPAVPATLLSIAELDQQWANLPHLDPEDAVLLAADLREIHQNATLPNNLWD